MANIIDRFLNSMKLYDDDDDDYDEEDFEEEREREERRSARRQHNEVSAEEPKTPARSMTPQEPEKSVARIRKPTRDNVVPMKSHGMEVCMVKPTSLDDAREICDILLSGRAVVINMEGVHVDLAQRIVDFTSGSVYSINGNLQKISKYIFIVSPQSIGLTGDFTEVLEGSQDLSSLSLNF